VELKSQQHHDCGMLELRLLRNQSWWQTVLIPGAVFFLRHLIVLMTFLACYELHSFCCDYVAIQYIAIRWHKELCAAGVAVSGSEGVLKQTNLEHSLGKSGGSAVLGSVIIPKQMEIDGAPLFTQCAYHNHHLFPVMMLSVCSMSQPRV
jgi:hypothetical protein